jgi:hypothetical protein
MLGLLEQLGLIALLQLGVVVAVGQQARRLETGFLGESVVPVVVEAVVLVGPELLPVVEVARMGQRCQAQAG